MTQAAAPQVAQQVAVRPIIEALYYAGIARPRVRPELDLSPCAFYPHDFYCRYGLFPAGVDLSIAMPERRIVLVHA